MSKIERLRKEMFALERENRRLRKRLAKIKSRPNILTQESYARSVDFVIQLLQKARNINIENI